MTADRPSPWLLGPVLSALGLFALAHHDVAFAGLCALLVLGAYGHRLTLPWPTSQYWPGFVGLALAAWGLSWVYYATVLQAGQGLLYFPRVYYKPLLITTSGMLLALTLVWLWHLPQATARVNGGIFLGSGCLVIASGNFLALPSWYIPCLVLFMATTLPALFVLGSGLADGLQRSDRLRGWRTHLLLGCTLIIGAGTGTISTLLPDLEARVSAAIIEMLQGDNPAAGIGAGDRLRIERYRRITLSHKIVLLLSGTTPPGYLRTQVMSQYHNGLWKPEPALTPSASPGIALHGPDGTSVALPSDTHLGSLQQLVDPATSVPAAQRTVTLLTPLRGAVPLPYTARRLTTAAMVACTLLPGALLHCTPAERLLDYSLTVDSVDIRTAYRLAATPEARAEVQQARQAPEAVLAALRALALQVVGPYANVPLAAAQLLQEYFRRHYTYSLHVNLANRGDPIVDFVLHRRPAYCEYYAAGLTLMLRALDIPARVVGGFAVREYNHLAGQWIVRQRDAHAWTEVFDATSNAWVAFDATPVPANTLEPATTRSTMLAQSWVWLTLQIQRFLVWMQTTEPRHWLDSLQVLGRALLRHPLGWLLLGAGVSLLLGITQRRRLLRLWSERRWRPGGKPLERDNLDRTAVEIQRLFEQVARALRDAGLPIATTETLEEYLQRIQPLQSTDWAQATPRPAPSLACYQALRRFAQVYTVLRFAHPGATVPELDPAMPSLALLRHWAEQVCAALQIPPSQKALQLSFSQE